LSLCQFKQLIFVLLVLPQKGTTVNLNVYFQYKLKVKELAKLYEQTDLNYRSYIKNIAIDAIKNEAPMYSADQFFQERMQIEQNRKEALTSKLNDFYVDVVGMQLRQIEFPFEFYRNKLNAAVQDERNSEENYRKEGNITGGENLKEVKFVQNDASLLEKNAQSRAALILANATHASTRVYERTMLLLVCQKAVLML